MALSTRTILSPQYHWLVPGLLHPPKETNPLPSISHSPGPTSRLLWVDRHDINGIMEQFLFCVLLLSRLLFFFFFFILKINVTRNFFGEGSGNRLQCSCLENPRDGGTWGAAVCGTTDAT